MTFFSGETLTAADLNAMLTSISNNTATIAALQAAVTALQAATLDSGWINVAGGVGFAGTWTNFAGGWDVAAYRKIGKVVYLKGLVAGGAVGSTIFTLPAGYIPAANIMFAQVVDTRSFGSTVSGTIPSSNGTSGNPSPNATGAASAGTAHTHSLSTHDHGLGHTHALGGIGATAAGTILNIGMRLDISSGGAVSAASSSATAYQSITCSFVVP